LGKFGESALKARSQIKSARRPASVILTRSTLIFRPLPALMVSAVTAAVIESVFAEGKTMACLYTDLRNPSSNRCYARIGFRPVCDSAQNPGAANRTAGMNRHEYAF
jgi:hypothetical protein